MEISNNIHAALIKLYESDGVVVGKEQGKIVEELPLHISCPDKDICWIGCDTNKECDWNKIQLPYVGCSYVTSPKRLVVLGINLNQDGGLCALKRLIDKVQESLLSGCKKVKFKEAPKYPGSLFWHRVAVYSFMLLNDRWTLDNEKNEIMCGNISLLDNSEGLGEVFDRIAFLEAIKCSPHWDRSRPTPEMWNKCPERFLKHELKILVPDNILVLGKNSIPALGIDPNKPDKVLEKGRIKVFYNSIGDKPVTIYNIIHPTAPGGASKSIVLALGSILENKEEL